MAGRRRFLALSCAIMAPLLFSGTGYSQTPPPIQATLTVDSGNNTIGTGPATFRLELSRLDTSTHEVDILWELEAQNGTTTEVLFTNSTVTGTTSEVFWNHTSLSEGLWTAHATLSPNGSNAWMINLSVELIHIRPAHIVILPSATWDVKWNEAGGSAMNGTPSSGDDIDISMRVENLGDVAAELSWTLHARHGVNEIGNATGNISVGGGERVLVGPLSLANSPEGVITLVLTANTSNQSNITTSIDLTVSPPPLPILHTTLDESEMILIYRIWNNGTVSAHADITCTRDATTLVENTGILLEAGSLTEITVDQESLEGTYACTTAPLTRIHASSVTAAQMAFNRPGPKWSLLGDPIAVEGPRHVSDIFELLVPIENAGSAIGNATLRLIQNGTASTGNSVSVAAGSSEVLSATTVLSSAGQLTLFWEVIDTESETVHEQGSLNISILPPQTLELVSAEVVSNTDTTYDLSAILALSPGTSRIVDFEVTSEGVSRHYSNQQIHPGNQTVRIGVPLVDSDRQLLLILHQSNWGDRTVHSITLDVNVSEPTAKISIIGGWPDQALPGDVLTIQTEVSNTGQSMLAEGVLRATRAADGFLLAEKSTPRIGTGESAILILDFEEWPSGPGGTVLWHYRSENGAEAEHQGIITLPRQNIIPSKSLSEDFEFRDVQVGAAFGIIGIALIAIGRAVARSPSFAERGDKNAAKDTEEVEESVEREVQCPSCDQRLTVPTTYRGRARCTRCGDVFSAAPPDDVGHEGDSVASGSEKIPEEVPAPPLPEPIGNEGGVKTSEESPESSSSSDAIECPTCSQRLRVPLDRRPAKARCPACSSTFMALAE